LATGFVRRDVATFLKSLVLRRMHRGSSAAIRAKACEDTLGLTMAAEMLAGARTGRKGPHALAGLFDGSQYLAVSRGHENVNGAERLRHDAAMR
jgi:hypothetical protein